ncbi:MAG: hypothetical protein A2017_01660 [Lentisphaerae bacterium GWF2_44_16]|nr:MAG: hypothetical protein A2017_01660 [Lentisphaerae bacterium GWF2_44_16]
MFLSIWTNYFADLPLDEALKKIAGAGFKYAELDSLKHFMKNGNTPGKILKIKSLCEKLGIKIYQLHGYFGAYLEKNSHDWDKQIELCKKEIKIASELGIEIIVMHPICPEKVNGKFRKTSISQYQLLMKNNICFYKAMINSLEKYGVKIALENMPSDCNCFYSAEELLELMDALDSERFGICMDTSHLQVSNQNISRFIMKAGDKLIATHISDSLEGKYLDLHLMPLFAYDGDGWIDWFSVRDALDKISYNGGFNLEIPKEGAMSAPLPIREKKIKFAHEYLSEFLEKKF